MGTEYIDVEVKGLKEMWQELDKLGSYVQRTAALKMTQSTSSALARAVRNECPVHEGGLKKSIRSLQIAKKDLNGIRYRVGFRFGKGWDGYKGHLVEFGTAPHLIPRKGKVKPMKIGNTVFMGPIEHPGTKPNRFVTRAFENYAGRAIKTGERAFVRTFQKYKGRP